MLQVPSSFFAVMMVLQIIARTVAATAGNKLAHQLRKPGRIAEWIVGIF